MIKILLSNPMLVSTVPIIDTKSKLYPKTTTSHRKATTMLIYPNGMT